MDAPLHGTQGAYVADDQKEREQCVRVVEAEHQHRHRRQASDAPANSAAPGQP